MWTSSAGRFGRSRSDLPDRLLAVAAARLVPADLPVALPQLACGHRPEPPALGLHVESLAGRRHRASSGCSLPRAGHSDAQVGHEIKACRARFREDSLAAESSQAADAACEEVAEGAQAPWVGVGFVVVRHGGRRARGLYPCISAMETRVFRIEGKCSEMAGGTAAFWADLLSASLPRADLIPRARHKESMPTPDEPAASTSAASIVERTIGPANPRLVGPDPKGQPC